MLQRPFFAACKNRNTCHAYVFSRFNADFWNAPPYALAARPLFLIPRGRGFSPPSAARLRAHCVRTNLTLLLLETTQGRAQRPQPDEYNTIVHSHKQEVLGGAEATGGARLIARSQPPRPP